MTSKLPDARLPEATDCLNGALLEAEDALRAMSLGVMASVPLDADRQLVFRKRGTEFRLCVIRGGDETTVTELLTTARKTRIDAVRHLPALRDALLEAYEAELARVERAIADVHAFTNTVRALTP